VVHLQVLRSAAVPADANRLHVVLALNSEPDSGARIARSTAAKIH
jgi:hypothetical protein